MANKIDLLMDLDPLELSSQDIDKIIAYQRKAKANFDAGIKPKKGGENQIQASDLLNKLGMIPKAPAIKRRV